MVVGEIAVRPTVRRPSVASVGERAFCEKSPTEGLASNETLKSRLEYGLQKPPWAVRFKRKLFDEAFSDLPFPLLS